MSEPAEEDKVISKKRLGPTSIEVIFSEKVIETFEIVFTFNEPEAFTFEDGDVGYSWSGSTKMTSQAGSNTIRLTAANELQLTALLMKTTFVWITSVCGPDAQVITASGAVAGNALEAFS